MVPVPVGVPDPRAAALMRAMPRHRLVGNGMTSGDAEELFARAARGADWTEVACGQGHGHLAAAESALADGLPARARVHLLRAASCFRVAQVPLADGPKKQGLYRRLIDAFGRAGALCDPPAEHVRVPWRGRELRGWLLRPSGARMAPVVMVLGGIDAWREEFAVGAEVLRAQGLAVFLLDAPGQGETRVLAGVHLDRDIGDALSAAVGHLVADPRLNGSVAVWGNSMGGHLAALLAARDARVAACVVTGGTTRPAETHTRFPRFLEKVQAMVGLDDPGAASEVLHDLELGPDALAGLTCPLLVQHGRRDPVFKVANARQLHDLAGSADRTWQEWSDGDHCVDNHAEDKHRAIADWLLPRLLKRGPRTGAEAPPKIGSEHPALTGRP